MVLFLSTCEKTPVKSRSDNQLKTYSNESGVSYELAKNDPGCDVDRNAPKAKARGCQIVNAAAAAG